MKTFRHFSGVATLCFDNNLCIGCGNCLDVCPHQVFALQDGKALVLDRDACMECGACVTNCPVEAVYVRPGVGCAQAILYGWLIKMPILRKVLSPDSCCP